MKLLLKQTKWNALRVQSSTTNEFEYDDNYIQEGVQTVFDNKIIRKRGSLTKVFYKYDREVDFSFTIIKRYSDSVKLSVGGVCGGGEYDKNTNTFKDVIIKLTKHSPMDFSSNSFDAGTNYTLELVD